MRENNKQNNYKCPKQRKIMEMINYKWISKEIKFIIKYL